MLQSCNFSFFKNNFLGFKDLSLYNIYFDIRKLQLALKIIETLVTKRVLFKALH